MTYAVLGATCQSDRSENVVEYQCARPRTQQECSHCWLTEQWGTTSCPVVAKTSVPEAVTLGNGGLVCVMCLLKSSLVRACWDRGWHATMTAIRLPRHDTCLRLALNQLSQSIFGFISICAMGVMPPLQLPPRRVLVAHPLFDFLPDVVAFKDPLAHSLG